jgi:hypothetical protein
MQFGQPPQSTQKCSSAARVAPNVGTQNVLPKTEKKILKDK